MHCGKEVAIAFKEKFESMILGRASAMKGKNTSLFDELSLLHCKNSHSSLNTRNHKRTREL